MSLADFQPERAKVAYKGGDFDVRGLTLNDVAILLRHHLDDLEALIVVFSRDFDQTAIVSAVTQHGVALIKEAPGLVANLIAIASDEPDEVDQARALSMHTQVNALETIARLTFDEAGGAKKFVESLNHLLRGLRPTLLKTDSPT